MDRLTEQYRQQFYGEAREILERLSDDILRAEAAPDDAERLNAVFRGIHTIKGSAGSFDLDGIATFAHHFEGMLSALRDGRVELTPDTVDLVLAGADHIGKMVDDCAAGKPPVVDDALIDRFRAMGETGSTACADGVAGGQTGDGGDRVVEMERLDPTLPEAIQRQFEDAAAIGLYLYRIQPRFSSELLENGYDPMVFLGNLRAACTAYAAIVNEADVPGLDGLSPLTLYLGPTVYAATALSSDEIRELTFDPGLVGIETIRLTNVSMDAEPLQDFVDGAVEMLESLEKAVIDYETSGSRDALNEIFRVVHSVKGDADLIGLREITVFAHSLESLLERLRSGTIKRTFALVDVILQSVDYLRQSVLRLGQGVKLPEFPPVLETLKRYAAMKDDIDRRGRILGDVPPDLADVFTEQARQYKALIGEYGSRAPADEAAVPILRRAFAGLAVAADGVGLGSLREQAEKGAAAMESGNADALAEAAERITTFIDSVSGEGDRDDAGPERPVGGTADFEKTARGESRTMRIDEGKVDHFTNLVGELLIARNTYAHLMEVLETDGRDAKGAVKALKENLHLFSRLTNDIHHGVMSLRMAPIGRIFGKFNRTIRDIGRRQKKSIHLMTGGGDIEIDKKVADMLSDPLIHLVRNACDHGIEPPEDRRAAGKPEGGTVVISASQEGSNLVISVVDDGRGIDRESLCEAARRAGHASVSPEETDLLDILFLPGFSTSDRISDISGRGVGLDVVKTAIDGLGGTVHLTSGEGKGTEVVLSIPTTLGIDAVLFVDSGDHSYAIPLENIAETLKLDRRRLKRAGHRLLFSHRGGVLPAGRLEDILAGAGLGDASSGTHPPALADKGGDGDAASVVILRTRLGKYGLIVDRMKKNMEVAMKPLPGILAGIDLFGGVTIMGDGSVMLVLNPDKLVRGMASGSGQGG